MVSINPEHAERDAAYARYKAALEESFKPVESSTIAAITQFDGDVYVKFKNGSVYQYKDVPQEVYDKFCKAESKGRFFAQFIRNNYNYDYRY